MVAIVTVNVSQQIAPTPSTLQQSGALISQGATTLAAGGYRFLTQLGDLTSILAQPLANLTLSWLSNVVTVTTAAPHGFTNGAQFQMVIAGVTPTGYNGTYLVTITGLSTFTYALVGNPGATTAVGTYIPASVSELQSMANTFFAQGTSTGVYVLELGANTSTINIAALATWITNSPSTFYSYLTPRNWGSDGTFPAFLAQYEGNTAKTYFFVTMTTGNYTNFPDTLKDVVGLVEAPGLPSTEFTLAGAFQVSLSNKPSGTNRITPFCYAFIVAVTPYPTAGNATLLGQLAAANVNVIGTGAEGGLSDTILLYGTTLDGNDFTYWFSIDWLQINLDLQVSNAVINGSNNPAAPLYYNQDGINFLQSRGASVLAQAITFGLAIGTVTQVAVDPATFSANYSDGVYDNQAVINAVPLTTYLAANPGDYKIGHYAGFTVAYTPSRGFRTIVFNVVVSSFVVP